MNILTDVYMFVKGLNQPDASCYYFRIISIRVAVNVRIQGAKESSLPVGRQGFK
jgi:hypothetical protein